MQDLTPALNIVLVGFMGTGKSSVAKLLAASTQRTVVEMDDLIEEKEGMSIGDIFAKKGEPYFRQKEREVVGELSGKRGLVISTGGGVVLNEDNITDFKKSGVVVCLSAQPKTIHDRVKGQSHRPLLETDELMKKIESLLEQRRPFYEQADATIATDGRTTQAIAEEVVRIVKELKPNETR